VAKIISSGTEKALGRRNGVEVERRERKEFFNKKIALMPRESQLPQCYPALKEQGDVVLCAARLQGIDLPPRIKLSLRTTKYG